MYICAPCTLSGSVGSQKRASDPLELELWRVVVHGCGAEN